MSLFKKKEVKVKVAKPECACHDNCPVSEIEVGNIAKDSEDLNIKVLGSGCKNCKTLHENTLQAIETMGIKANVEYITDMEIIMGYGVMSMPALVVNEKVVSMGKVYKADGVIKLLNKLGY